MPNLFDDIYLKYKDDVFRLIYSYTLNFSDAEDILQQTFIKLYKNINKFNKTNIEVKKWLFRVAINNSKNYLNSFWKKNSFVPEDINIFGEYSKGDDLFDFISHVPKKYRISLYLYYYEGYSIKEISKLLKVSESAIKLRLKRGKEKLKQEMGNDQ